MLRKHLSLFLALLMIFTVIPEVSLAENGADEPESPTSIGFLNADSCDETLVYHYTVEASPGDTIMLAPEPDYNGDGELLYRWMRFDAEQNIYVELPNETENTLEITVSEDEFGVKAIYACEVSDGEISGMAVFSFIKYLQDYEYTSSSSMDVTESNATVLLANGWNDWTKSQDM